MDITDDIKRILQKYCGDFHGGNLADAANSLQVKHSTLLRWINGKSYPPIDTLIPVFNKLNARILLPGEVIDTKTKSNSIEIGEVEKLKMEIKMEGMLIAMQAIGGKNITLSNKNEKN